MSAERKRPTGPPPSAGVLARHAQAYARELGVAEGRVRASPAIHQRMVPTSGRDSNPRRKRLVEAFPVAVCEVLDRVGVAAADIAEERSRMSEIAFGRTRNRSLLGTLNDFAFMAQVGHARRPELETPEELTRFPAHTPILPLDGASPIELTRAVFRGK